MVEKLGLVILSDLEGTLHKLLFGVYEQSETAISIVEMPVNHLFCFAPKQFVYEYVTLLKYERSQVCPCLIPISLERNSCTDAEFL